MSAYAQLIDDFLRSYDRLQLATEGLSVEELRWKPGPDKWSVTEVLTHVTDHQIVVAFRLREILSGSDVRLPAFSQDPWVSNQHANEANVSDILEAFRALLVYHAQLLLRLPDADWDKSAVNFKGETVTVQSVVRGFANHVRHHLGQIDRIRQAYAEFRASSLEGRS